jgi:hypothetical protein
MAGLGFASNSYATDGRPGGSQPQTLGKRKQIPPQRTMYRYTASQVGQPFRLGITPWWRERVNNQLAAPAYTDYIER